MSATAIKYPTKADPAKASKVLKGWQCEREDLHTPAPTGYLGWHEWARQKSKTHVQRRCPGCTLFKVWVPRKRKP